MMAVKCAFTVLPKVGVTTYSNLGTHLVDLCALLNIARTLLGLFCASVSLQKSDEIPTLEWIFYVFVAGLLLREIREFSALLKEEQDRIPPEERSVSSINVQSRPEVWNALSKYLLYDTWNILDTLTIVVVFIAFTFRTMALGENWSAEEGASGTPVDSSFDRFFAAQFFFALSAPLLFARVLFLYQVNNTLGPMTQIIWGMVSHLARFGVFLMVIIASFALAFNALFFTCCDRTLDLDLYDAFGTFWLSLLTMFESMLGTFDFDIFRRMPDTCKRPRMAYGASVLLLAAYLVIMTILLLNLLIAVLSTVHAKVDAKSEEEYNLARAKLIVHTARGIFKSRQPTPFNLIGLFLGIIFDISDMVAYAIVSGRRYSSRWGNKSSSNNEGRTKSENPSSYDNQPSSVSEGYKARTIEGAIHRGLFALTMGLVTLTISLVLWTASIPWLGWQSFRFVYPPPAKRKWRGYNQALWKTIFNAIGWFVGTITAIGYCAMFILPVSFLLWLVGLLTIAEWADWRLTRGYETHKDLERRMIQPGEERGELWQTARRLAQATQFIEDYEDSGHYHVAPLLKMTTGLNLDDLWSNIQQKEKLERLAEKHGQQVLHNRNRIDSTWS